VAILNNHALTRRRRLAVPIPRPTVLIQLLAAAMAAEAERHTVVAEAERHTVVEVAERHMVVEAAVHTAIVKISAFHKGPPFTQRGGPFAFFLSQADPKVSAQLSRLSRV
jgi:hypothetical protein